MPGIVTVSLLALPSVVLPLTLRLAERVVLFVTVSVPPREVLLPTSRVELSVTAPTEANVP